MLPAERRTSSDSRGSGHSPRSTTESFPHAASNFPRDSFLRGASADPSGTPLDFPYSGGDQRYPEQISPKDTSRYDSSRLKRSDPRMANVDLPSQRLSSDPRMGSMSEDYRGGFPTGYSPAAQDSDLRSTGMPPQPSRSLKYQDTDLRVTPSSYVPPQPHHRN